jgi:hypothetical protein
MTLWVLDTDHLSLLERGNPKIQNRLRQIEANSVAITIVTELGKSEGKTGGDQSSIWGGACRSAGCCLPIFAIHY